MQPHTTGYAKDQEVALTRDLLLPSPDHGYIPAGARGWIKGWQGTGRDRSYIVELDDGAAFLLDASDFAPA